MSGTTPSRSLAFLKSSSCVTASWQAAGRLSHMVGETRKEQRVLLELLCDSLMSSHFLRSHPGLAAHSSRPVHPTGLQQSRCRQGAGDAEGGGGLHAAQTHPTPPGTDQETGPARPGTVSRGSHQRSCVSAAGVGDVHPGAAAVSQRERG